MRCSIAARLLILVLLGHASSANANGRFPQSNQITMHPLDANVIVARTTFGLLVSDDHGANFHWICEQVLETRAALAAFP